MLLKKSWKCLLLATAATALGALSREALADVKMPNVFGTRMVLQREQPIPFYGSADAGEEVTVAIGETSAKATAGANGKWQLKLPAMKAGGPHVVTVKGKNTLKFEDVLVGEVWICSGQSNMQWSVNQSYDADLEKLTANHPNIRLISVPQVGTQEPQDNFKGEWSVCTPDTVGDFSGVGFFFGRQLHQTLNVPIGLIDNAWGGSAAEAWVRRDILEKDGKYGELLAKWDDLAKTYNHDKAVADFKVVEDKWKEAAKKAKDEGKPEPARPRAPTNQLTGNHRPANIYNGVLKPTIGYGIKGSIWYQGESNAGRAYQYRDLFPLMIQSWRDEWAQGDFPFYWVQLADFMAEAEGPDESNWAELREAQTMTLDKLKNVGQAVIIDIGEGKDIHPRNKIDVGKRLARIALAKDYGVKIVGESPRYKSMEVKDGKAILTFDNVGGGLITFDVQQAVGFAIAGEDKKFVWAQAKVIAPDKVEVTAEGVAKPVSVRYGWANNPVTNLQNKEGLPVTPFRTDDWPGLTAGVVK